MEEDSGSDADSISAGLKRDEIYPKMLVKREVARVLISFKKINPVLKPDLKTDPKPVVRKVTKPSVKVQKNAQFDDKMNFDVYSG